MSIKQFSRKGLLTTALVMSLGSFSVAQAAGEATPPPVMTTPALPTAKPAMPMTAPALPTAQPAVPMTTPALPTAKPAATPTSALGAGAAANPDGSCPETAPVKISKSKIYHVPEGRNYAKTKAQQCFASAEAAEQAGYRAPKK
ncbi:MAG: hypothetical protein WAT67_11810 [Candidatus Contendobacter sp.]